MNMYLVFHFGFVPIGTLITFLNSRQEIRNWYTFGNILAIVATTSLAETQNLLFQAFGAQSFVVVPVDGPHTGGSMPKQFWDFINNPSDSGHWPSLAQGIAGGTFPTN